MVMERVQKILARFGVASRRKCEELIEAGKVKVNGTVITIGASADAQKDKFEVNGKRVVAQDLVYLMINKPPGFITTVSDMYDRKTVMDLLPEHYVKMRVYPIGRLDRDAEGLLLFTNDGDFAQRIAHPSSHVTKVYRVWLDKKFTHKQVMKKGVKLDEGFVDDIDITVLSSKCVEISVSVGWHKVVKRLFQEFDYRVERLVRIQIGPILLGNLKDGQYKYIKKTIITQLKKSF